MLSQIVNNDFAGFDSLVFGGVNALLWKGGNGPTVRLWGDPCPLKSVGTGFVDSFGEDRACLFFLKKFQGFCRRLVNFDKFDHLLLSWDGKLLMEWSRNLVRIWRLYTIFEGVRRRAATGWNLLRTRN